MIIVMPNGNEALFMDDDGPFPEMVVEELIPTIDRRLCTWGDADHRGIGGLSRGGYWAFWIAFSHPELFNRVGGHSPYLYEPEFSSDKNVFNIVDTAPGLDNLAIYLDHGGENREIIEVQPGVEALVARLEDRGLSPLYVANSTGDHDEEYWSAHVSEYLAFYAGDWPRDATQFPSCADPTP
jgi:enterochelin esterase-like enzyme